MYSNDLKNSLHGIIVYVNNLLQSKQLHFDSDANEHLVIEITFNHIHLAVTTVYRSPSSTDENNDTFIYLISEICSQHFGSNLIIGDFNYNIDWTVHHLNTNDSSNQKFYETVQKNFFARHVYNPTRCRGSVSGVNR